MPQTTALRRVSTFMVGALFAVVFVCSGASAAQVAAPQGESLVSAHTATSKAAARTVSHQTAVKHKSPAPLHLATTVPSAAGDSPAFVVDVASHNTGSSHTNTLFTTSERAPPAL